MVFNNSFSVPLYQKFVENLCLNRSTACNHSIRNFLIYKVNDKRLVRIIYAIYVNIKIIVLQENSKEIA